MWPRPGRSHGAEVGWWAGGLRAGALHCSVLCFQVTTSTGRWLLLWSEEPPGTGKVGKVST